LLEEKGGGMRCLPSFVKINPCRVVVDDYKVRDKIGAGYCMMPAFRFVSSFFDTKLGSEKLEEKMLMLGRLQILL
ncbi:MAG: hypothetical protein FD170_2814, partial [Bacteroidetes bacterium]